jgi:phage gpG-like protein
MMIDEREVQALFRNILYTIGNEVRREYEQSGEYTKHGIQYKNLPNRSSSPYESPAKQSGNLHSNIDVVANSQEVKIGSNVPYLKFLELGTNKMQPRNGLDIAFNRLDIIAIIDNKINQLWRR